MAQLKQSPPRVSPSKRAPQQPQPPLRAAVREGIIAGVAIAAIDLVAAYQMQSAGPDTGPAATIALLDLLATIFLVQFAGFRAGTAAYAADSESPAGLAALALLTPSSRAGLGAGALAGAVAGVLNSIHLLFFQSARLLQEPGATAAELTSLVLMNVILGAVFGFSSGWLAGLVRRSARQ
jgi:hypothetical protein